MVEMVKIAGESNNLPCHQSLLSSILRLQTSISKDTLQELIQQITENDKQRMMNTNERVAVYMQLALMYSTHTEKVEDGL